MSLSPTHWNFKKQLWCFFLFKGDILYIYTNFQVQNYNQVLILQHYIPPQSKTVWFNSWLFKAFPLNIQFALIGQLTQAWVSTTHYGSVCLQLSVSFTCTVNWGINHANVWHCDVTELKAGLLTRLFRHFKSCVFCAREELPLTLAFLDFMTRVTWYYTGHWRSAKTKKSIKGLL